MLAVSAGLFLLIETGPEPSNATAGDPFDAATPTDASFWRTSACRHRELAAAVRPAIAPPRPLSSAPTLAAQARSRRPSQAPGRLDRPGSPLAWGKTTPFRHLGRFVSSAAQSQNERRRASRATSTEATISVPPSQRISNL